MTLIKNADIYDGTGEKPYCGDILFDKDKILEISPKISAEDIQVIDARGKCVTPGFIDAHRHCDLAALFDPEFGKAELLQGITTAICGNCGLSPAPSSKEILDYIEPCLGSAGGAVCDFPTVSAYISELEKRRLPINLGVLAASGTISAKTKGYGARSFSEKQLLGACEYIDDAMDAGALGLSCGIMYDPECYTSPDEFTAMAKAAARHGGYLTAHIRGEGNSLIQSIKEVIGISSRAEIPLNISHFKVTGIKSWGHGIDSAIELIDTAGNVTVDAYPYTAGSTTIMSLLPPTVTDINDLDFLKAELQREHKDWDNMVSSIGWENIVISSTITPGHRKYCGMSFANAAEAAGTEPHILMSELIRSNRGKVGVILMSMDQKDVNKVLALPYCSVISDALYGGGDMPHPRLYGAFPRIIKKCVMQDKLLSLEEAIKKMTALPAKRLGLHNTGVLCSGYQADILIFDKDKISDNATFFSPKEFASGIDNIFLAGNEVLHDGKITDCESGRFIHK